MDDRSTIETNVAEMAADTVCDLVGDQIRESIRSWVEEIVKGHEARIRKFVEAAVETTLQELEKTYNHDHH